MKKKKLLNFNKSKKIFTIFLFLLSLFAGYSIAYNSKLNAKYAFGESLAKATRQDRFGKTTIEFIPTDANYDNQIKSIKQSLKRNPYFFSFYGYYSRVINYNKNHDFVIKYNSTVVDVSPTIFFSPTLYVRDGNGLYNVEFDNYQVLFPRGYATTLRSTNEITEKKSMIISDALADLLILQLGLGDYDELLLATFSTELKDFNGGTSIIEFQISNIYLNNKGIAIFESDAYNPYGVLLRNDSMKLPDTRLHVDFVNSPYTNYKIFEMMEILKEELDTEINFLKPGSNFDLELDLMRDYQLFQHQLESNQKTSASSIIILSFLILIFILNFVLSVIKNPDHFILIYKFKIHFNVFLLFLIFMTHVVLSILKFLISSNFSSHLFISPLYTYVSIIATLMIFLLSIFSTNEKRGKHEDI